MGNSEEKTHPEMGYTYANVGMIRQWEVMIPPVYRFMESRYVDDFFNYGKLRLSSFLRFSKHVDEQRKDASEGWSIVFSDGPGGGTVAGAVAIGSDFYVLCGTMNFTKDICRTFGDCDACMVIDQPMGFADAVSNRIPFFKMGVSGPAVYRESRVIRSTYDPKRLAELVEKYGVAKTSTEDNIEDQIKVSESYPQEIKDEISRILWNTESIFLKNSVFSSQAEYRIFWQSTKKTEEYIDITVPEAIQFCRRVSL